MRALTTVWLGHPILRALGQEAEAKIPNETGGILMGYWSEDSDTVVVTDWIGPGPRAEHTPDRFAPDYDFQDAEVARIYSETHGAVTYLGDWHSHPSTSPSLSRKDRKTLSDIATDPDSRAPRAIMAILGCNPRTDFHDRAWSIGVWEYRAKWPLLSRMSLRWSSLPCEIVLWSPDSRPEKVNQHSKVGGGLESYA